METNTHYPLWSPRECSAWAPPEDITVSQWAALHRVLPEQSAIPGLWNNRLGPYAVGIMDSFNNSEVERITIMASVQSMKTESVYNMLGFAICQDPSPALIVMPTLNTMKRVNRRIRKMLLISPELSSHLTGNPDDVQMHQIVLDRMEIFFATAGSAPDLQNVEARYIIVDETDEYPVGTEEGDAVERAVDRSTTYWNRKIIELSRPTTPEGYIHKSYQKSDRRKFWVPCPLCAAFQVLLFRQVKHQGEALGEWPKDKRSPDYIKGDRVARYECEHCGGEINDKDKPEMLAQGVWVPEGHPFDKNTGELLGPLPPTSHVGFWWNVLYSPFRMFSEVAAQFFTAKDDPEKHRIFINQWLAEPWRDVVKQKETSALLELCTDREARVVPDGTVALTAGIDNHKWGCWCSIWAWVRLDSGLVDQHLIRYGWLPNWTELEGWLFRDVYHTSGGGAIYPVWRGGIDTGGSGGGDGDASMTEQVYQWLRIQGQGRIFGIKGASKALMGGKKMMFSVIDRMPGKGGRIPGGVSLWILDTNALKDAFWSRVEAGRVHLHKDTGEDFAMQLTAEIKVRNNRGREFWTLEGNQGNHLLDTTIYAAAMADPECWGGVMVLPRAGKAAVETQPPSVNAFVGQSGGSWLKR
jgi:phage terminase large subunit GpA-like protein